MLSAPEARDLGWVPEQQQIVGEPITCSAASVSAYKSDMLSRVAINEAEMRPFHSRFSTARYFRCYPPAHLDPHLRVYWSVSCGGNRT